MTIFVDTGAFYALADSSDVHHEKAKVFYTSQYKKSKFTTSDYVFVESWTLIHHKLGREASLKFWEGIRNKIVSLVNISQEDVGYAWEITNKYSDQDLSLVDCTSFALMERLDITDAFAFDHHFRIFRTKRNSAFTVHPY